MRRFRWIIVIALLGLLARGAGVRAQNARLTLDDLTLDVGATGVVTARLECVPQCSLFALTLTYDPSLVRVISVEFGNYLGSIVGGGALVAENVIDNTNGEVRLAAVALGTPPAITGEPLFRLTVVGQRFGTTLFTPKRAEFGDLSMPPVPLTPGVTGGRVIVLNVLPTATTLILPTITPLPSLTRLPTLTHSQTPVDTRVPTNTPRLPTATNTRVRLSTSAPSATAFNISNNLNIGGLALAGLGVADLGPLSGRLVSEADSSLEVYNLNVDMRDFAVQIDVQIPASIPTNWTFGLLFRDSTTDNQYRLIFSGSGVNMTWELRNRVGSESTAISSGTMTRPTGRTISLQLIALDDLGVVFWDDEFLTTLDLSARGTSGDVRFAIDIYSNSDGTLGTTAFSDFSIWELESAFGPDSGRLLHEDDQAVEVAETSIDFADFVTHATFDVPYTAGLWDIGFLFRDLVGNDEYRLIVESDAEWLFYEPGNLNTPAQRGRVTNLRTGAAQSNTLTLIALGDRGVALLNGAFISELDLSASRAAGPISVGTGIVSGHEIAGEVTAYRDFRVWR
ncbi:MAG: cohesin domain-containing protein [Chloroflexota bacterium]|nr:cohesin domain-containing protein [Chloroflexota bacterium]